MWFAVLTNLIHPFDIYRNQFFYFFEFTINRNIEEYKNEQWIPYQQGQMDPINEHEEMLHK
jgi:hypothetical protein